MFEALKARLAAWLRVPTDPPHLPEGQRRGTVFRAAPQFLTYQLVVGLLPIAVLFIVSAGLLIAGALTVVPGWAVALIAGVVPLLLGAWALLVVFGLRIEYELRFYALGDRTLRIREGVIEVRELTITLTNIQNVRVDQGPIEQALGIANVIVETAGGGGPTERPTRGGASGHRGILAGISNATEVRDLLRQAMASSAHLTGLGHPEEHPDVLAAPALRDVLAEAKGLADALEGRAGGTGTR